LPIDWARNLDGALKDPWGEGLPITGMFITAMAPCVLSVVAGLGSVFAAWAPNVRQATADIERYYNPNRKMQQALNQQQQDKIISAVRSTRYWGAIPAAIFVVLAIYVLLWGFEPFVQFIRKAAYCGLSLRGHGQCAWW
jgi:hypothetical protein